MQLKYFVHNTDCLQTFLLILQFIMLSLHSRFTTVIKVTCLQPLILSIAPGAFPVEECRVVGQRAAKGTTKAAMLDLLQLRVCTDGAAAGRSGG